MTQSLAFDNLDRMEMLTPNEAERFVKFHSIPFEDFIEEFGERDMYRVSLIEDWLGY